MRKNKFILLILSILIIGSSWAKEKKMKVYLNENQFYTQESGNYYEVQLHFAGYTLNYINEDSAFFAQVEITQLFEKDDEIIIADKYILNSPSMIDSIIDDFYDIQKYALAPGEYQYSLSILDVNSKKKNPLTVEKTITIEDLSKGLAFSTIIPAETIFPNPTENSIFTRIGYDVVPMLGSYYPVEIQNLLYYTEVYNTNINLQDSIYVVEQKIISQSDSSEIDGYTRYFRYSTSPIQPISKVVDISDLPTGAYKVQLSILNRKKNILTTTSFNFERNNTDEVNEIAYESIVLDPAFRESVPPDSIGYYVASLIPIAGQQETRNIIKLLKEKNSEKNYNYLQAFWKQSNQHSPYESWIKYKAQVQLVQRLYRTNYQVGFETDRGRVYLQYGAPTGIIDNPSSPSEYPYEIWQYNKIKQQTDKRFVFYNPTNLGNDYKLLHSDMLGEIQNYRWRYALNKRNSPNGDLDNPMGGSQEHFGGRSNILYNTY